LDRWRAFVLVRYCTSGSDALLEMGPRVVRQMDEIIKQAEAANTDAARVDAYWALKTIVSWLIVPLENPKLAYPDRIEPRAIDITSSSPIPPVRSSAPTPMIPSPGKRGATRRLLRKLRRKCCAPAVDA